MSDTQGQLILKFELSNYLGHCCISTPIHLGRKGAGNLNRSFYKIQQISTRSSILVLSILSKYNLK